MAHLDRIGREIYETDEEARNRLIERACHYGIGFHSCSREVANVFPSVCDMEAMFLSCAADFFRLTKKASGMAAAHANKMQTDVNTEKHRAHARRLAHVVSNASNSASFMIGMSETLRGEKNAVNYGPTNQIYDGYSLYLCHFIDYMAGEDTSHLTTIPSINGGADQEITAGNLFEKYLPEDRKQEITKVRATLTSAPAQ